MRQPEVEKAFENLCYAAQWAGIETTGLSLRTGSKVNGNTYRIFVITNPDTRRQQDWPYAPPGGFLGMTSKEAIKTLDTMRYVFYGITHVRAQQEYDARKDA